MEHINEKIRNHLKRLSPQDRYLRFGREGVTDESIDKYVKSIKNTDTVLYILDYDAQVVAFCHVGYGKDKKVGDLGISVDKEHRETNYARMLLNKAVYDAKARGVKSLYIYFLAENEPIYKLAKELGCSVMPYGRMSEAVKTLEPATVFDMYGDVVTDAILVADNNWKLIINNMKGWNNV